MKRHRLGKSRRRIDCTVIPEPSTWALLALGLTSVVVLRRRAQA